MKKQFLLIPLCLFCFSVLCLRGQVKSAEGNTVAAVLPDLQTAPWNLDYQIKMQNIQNPQFADVIRKRYLKNKLSLKEEYDAEYLKQKLVIGEARIKSGKASTTFKYDPKLTLKDYLLLRTDSYELRKIVEQNAELCLKLFRKALRDTRLAQNDIVDAGALAFTLSYEIYFGTKPSKDHLNWMREKGRSILLNLASFQGVDDAERQRTFEIFGVLTMYAKILQDRGLKGDKAAAEESKETAGEVLKEVWGSPADSIQMLPVGFIHRGQKLIMDGQATTMFKFNPNLQTAQNLSNGNKQIEAEYKSYLVEIYKTMSEKGMPINDSAACGAYSFSQIFPFAANVAEVNKPQFDSVYGALKKAVLNSPDIQAASDENKQITCELFVIRAALLKKQISANPTVDAKPSAEQYLNGLFQAYGENFKNYQMSGNNFTKIGATTAVNE